MPAREDKLGPLACATLWTAIDAQELLECSDGSRPGRGALEAGRDLTVALQYGTDGYVGEVNLKGFFAHLDHAWRLDMLRVRVDDRAFLRRIRKWLKAGMLETDGQVLHPEAGTPQGGTGSPILANASLHDALDLGCDKVVKPHCRGEALLCRYADDGGCACRYQDDAERFYRVLPKRLEQFNLQVAPEKTHLLRFSRFHPSWTSSRDIPKAKRWRRRVRGRFHCFQ
jgi:RNA-directed DNA polymerase